MASSKKVFTYATSTEKLYGVYFRLINSVLRLTKKEIEVAAALYSDKAKIDKDVSDDKIANQLLFSSSRRKDIRDSLGMSSLLFNNYLQNLKEKKVVLDVDGVKIVNPKMEIDGNKDLQIIFNVNVQQ